MTNAERFALNQWLSDYPQNLSYDEIITVLQNEETELAIDDIWVWELIEGYDFTQVAQFIDDTRKAFEHATSEVTA
jgi:hypothetical protein